MATRLLFVAVGCSFAIVKVAVYSFVGLLTDSARGHASLLNLVEGVFMVGVPAGYWIFAASIDADDPGSPRWLGVYWWLAGSCVVGIALLASVRYDESASREAGVSSAMPRSNQAAMVGLIVVFSALGGTTGSLVIGRVFAAVEGAAACYLILVPIAALLGTITLLRKMVGHRA